MKPVIVGIDPGGNRGEPMDPLFPSGSRLARLMGLSAEEFKDETDRINLHPDVVQGNDRLGAVNLFPILRGRRVLALGRRTAEALRIGGPTLEWSVQGSFVGTWVSHPSLRSRWWNFKPNERMAQKFLLSLCTPCIQIEGVDGSGKSVLAQDLADRLRIELTPTQDPPRSWDECLDRIAVRIRPGIVCDRSSGLLSELVYGPVLRGKTIISEDSIWQVVRAVIHSIEFVYCRPDYLCPTFRWTEEETHVEGVKKSLGKLSARYDEVMNRVSSMGGRVHRYDWEKDRVSDLIAALVPTKNPCTVRYAGV